MICCCSTTLHLAHAYLGVPSAAWHDQKTLSLGVKAKGAGSNIYSSSVESSLLFPPLDIIMLARHPADIISESESFSFFIDTPASERAGQRRTNINQSFRSHYRTIVLLRIHRKYFSFSRERMAGGCMGGCWRVAPPKKIWISYSETRYWNRFMV